MQKPMCRASAATAWRQASTLKLRKEDTRLNIFFLTSTYDRKIYKLFDIIHLHNIINTKSSEVFV